MKTEAMKTAAMTPGVLAPPAAATARHARVIAMVLVMAMTAGCGQFGDPSSRAAAEAAEQWTMLDRYCVDCHNNAEFTGDFSFEALGPESIAEHAELFEKAVRKLHGRLMPPPGWLRVIQA